jgi:hypothetical protein
MTAIDLVNKYLLTNAIHEFDIDQIRNDSELRSAYAKIFVRVGIDSFQLTC